MHAIDTTGAGYTARIEEMASERDRDLALSCSESGRSSRAAGELRCDRTARLFHGRRSDDQDRRNRHAWFDRRLPDCTYERRDPLGRKPGIVLMHGLEIVRAEHHDDQRERRIDFDALREPGETIASRLERIVPHSAPAVQAIFDDANRSASREQRVLQHARPACVELEAFAGIGNDAPREGIGVYEYLLHGGLMGCYSISPFSSTRLSSGS